MTDWPRALELAGDQLLTMLVVGTATVCVLGALALLWDRLTRPRPEGGAYYVGRHDEVYFVAYSHVARLEWNGPGWGPDVDGRPLGEAILRHRTGRRPRDRELSALALWLELQPEDGFVLDTATLAKIVGAPLAGRPRLAPPRALRSG